VRGSGGQRIILLACPSLGYGLDVIVLWGAQVSALATAVEAIDPTWSETLLIVTAHHGGIDTGHDIHSDMTLYERSVRRRMAVASFGANVRVVVLRALTAWRAARSQSCSQSRGWPTGRG
jgi:hypothetical protein